MKTIALLISSYFLGTPLNRGFTIGGLALLAIAAYFLTMQAQSGELLWVAILGLIALFMGGSLMPLMFGRLGRSHAIRILPNGRLKLLLSAFITVVLVSTPVALLTPFAFVTGMGGSATDLVKYRELLDTSIQMGWAVFTASILLVGWLYLAMWFVTNQRDVAGLFKGLVVLVVLIFAPMRQLRDMDFLIGWQFQQIAVIWSVFGAGFLLWPRINAAITRRGSPRFSSFVGGPRNITGREFDLMLGTENPWLLMAGLVLPVVISTRFAQDAPSFWLFFLTIFSTVAGASAGRAAERSRALWLRGNWSRVVLFSQVERSFWRHNSFVLGLLLMMMVAIGTFMNFPVTFLAVGLPLLALGTVLSTYLGLMITRGIHWVEAILGITVMLGLMVVAVLALEEIDAATVVGLEAVLAALAVVLRFEARRRWLQIDWMLCRPDRSFSARGT